MTFENPIIEDGEGAEERIRVEIRPEFGGFLPEEFRRDPVGYFEREGKNVKSGEIKRDETGRVRDDPTAVKELPVWKDAGGNELRTIGKRVNVAKGKVGESGDPFYEYQIMELVRELGLPAAKPIAKVEQSGNHLIVMEKVVGIGSHDQGYEWARELAEVEMLRLKALFDEAGIERKWKLKDMIVEVDLEQKEVKKVTPVDWERTKINQEKLVAFRNKKI